jgi:hypothetical protein
MDPITLIILAIAFIGFIRVLWKFRGKEDKIEFKKNIK